MYIEALLIEKCIRVKKGDQLGLYWKEAPSPVAHIFDGDMSLYGAVLPQDQEAKLPGENTTFDTLPLPYRISLAGYVDTGTLILSVLALYCQPYIVNPIVSALYCQPYNVSPILSTLYCQPHSVSPIVSALYCQPYTVNPIVSALYCQPYIVNPIMSALYCQPYSVSPIVSRNNGNRIRFVSFNDTWSQGGYSVSCMTTFFSLLVAIVAIRPQIR